MTENKVKPSDQLRVRGLSVKTRDEIQNIADNLGIDFPVFIKARLREVVMSYPEEMRKERIKK